MPKPIDLTENNIPITPDQVAKPVGCGGACGGKCGTRHEAPTQDQATKGRQLTAFFYLVVALLFVMGGSFVKRYFVQHHAGTPESSITSDIAPAKANPPAPAAA